MGWREVQLFKPVFGQCIVIINTHKAAVDLFEKGSTIYSDRPRLVMAGEL
jgi:hypothetical protein